MPEERQTWLVSRLLHSMRPEKWTQQTCGIAETEEEEEGQDEARTKMQASNVHCEWMLEGPQTWQTWSAQRSDVQEMSGDCAQGARGSRQRLFF